MDMNIEISLTSRSKTNYFKKTKKQKKKPTILLAYIYEEENEKNIHNNHICGFKSTFVEIDKL